MTRTHKQDEDAAGGVTWAVPVPSPCLFLGFQARGQTGKGCCAASVPGRLRHVGDAVSIGQACPQLERSVSLSLGGPSGHAGCLAEAGRGRRRLGPRVDSGGDMGNAPIKCCLWAGAPGHSHAAVEWARLRRTSRPHSGRGGGRLQVGSSWGLGGGGPAKVLVGCGPGCAQLLVLAPDATRNTRGQRCPRVDHRTHS